MKRINDNDTVEVYNDYDHIIYMPSANTNDSGYEFEPKTEDGEPYYVSVLWKDIKRINPKTQVFKTGKLRFEPEMEDEIYKLLKISPEKDKVYYTRNQIEDMIINSNDDVINEVVSINDLKTIEKFLSLYIALDSTNKYDLSRKLEMYIRARKEEIEKGVKRTELNPTPTVNERQVVVETAVVDNDEIEEKPVKKAVTRKKTTVKKDK